jgi:hypothetical protein
MQPNLPQQEIQRTDLPVQVPSLCNNDMLKSTLYNRQSQSSVMLCQKLQNNGNYENWPLKVTAFNANGIWSKH